jgi:hypothetical protein
MKTLFTFALIITSVIFSNAQDLLLSEDFDYPVGSNLNQHGWRPLTTSTTNPIKVTNGLSKSGYSASGGAAYLNKNGQDVIRSFSRMNNGRIYLSFQINPKKILRAATLYNSNLPMKNTQNYFMFLSSSEEPNIPLIYFSLAQTYDNSHNKYLDYLIVSNKNNNRIGILFLGLSNINGPADKTYDVTYSYHIDGVGEEMSYIRSETDGASTIGGELSKVISDYNITNLANIVLSQSDEIVGSEVVVDRIRIGKTWGSVTPCIAGIENKFLKSAISDDDEPLFAFKVIDNLTNHEIVLKACANTEVSALTGGIYNFSVTPQVTDLTMAVPNGFKLNTIRHPSSGRQSVNELKTDSNTWPNYTGIYLLGNSNRVNSKGIPITGDAGIYEGEVSFEPTGSYCKKVIWKIKGIIENCDTKSDALLKEDFNYRKGETLTQNNWQPLTTATDNPIKVVDGLSLPDFSASGGAAYLNKSGQDVKRPFLSVDKDKIFMSFQLKYKDMQRINTLVGTSCQDYYNNLLGATNYFMFLSSKENPTQPLLKFSLISVLCIYPSNYVVVKDNNDKTLAVLILDDLNNLRTNEKVYDIRFVYYLSGEKKGIAHLRSNNASGYYGGVPISSSNISNLGHLVLAQSNANVGSEAIIDRIRIGTTLRSIYDSELNSNTTESVAITETESLNATIYPNTTAGRINLLINENDPEGDFEIRLSDKAGNNLYSNSGTWENQQAAIEQVLGRSHSGQYLLTIKQGNQSKTIRVFRNDN